eukprot:6258679-Alexandrium_andersonii.AAC.1
MKVSAAGRQPRKRQVPEALRKAGMFDQTNHNEHKGVGLGWSTRNLRAEEAATGPLGGGG